MAPVMQKNIGMTELTLIFLIFSIGYPVYQKNRTSSKSIVDFLLACSGFGGDLRKGRDLVRQLLGLTGHGKLKAKSEFVSYRGY